MINNLKSFNYKNIYLAEKTVNSIEYFKLILNKIFYFLKETFYNKNKMEKICPYLVNDFEDWLKNYWNLERNEENKNEVIFNKEDLKDYCQAIIYYIAGMTDNYAIEMYNKIISF